jgi:hypothetical protein
MDHRDLQVVLGMAGGQQEWIEPIRRKRLAALVVLEPSDWDWARWRHIWVSSEKESRGTKSKVTQTTATTMSHSRVRVRVSSWSILPTEVALLTTFQAVQVQGHGTLEDRGDDVKGSDLEYRRQGYHTRASLPRGKGTWMNGTKFSKG